MLVAPLIAAACTQSACTLLASNHLRHLRAAICSQVYLYDCILLVVIVNDIEVLCPHLLYHNQHRALWT